MSELGEKMKARAVVISRDTWGKMSHRNEERWGDMIDQGLREFAAEVLRETAVVECLQERCERRTTWDYAMTTTAERLNKIADELEGK